MLIQRTTTEAPQGTLCITSGWMFTTRRRSATASRMRAGRSSKKARWERRDVGPGEHGSLISEREQSANAVSLPTLAGNFDGEPNQRLKNARIVFGYFAQNTFKHPSNSSLPTGQRLDFIVTNESAWSNHAISEAILARGIRQWQPDLKTRVAGLGINLNIAPMLLHNSLDSVQSEARAFPHSFGREKRLKNMSLHLGRDSWTVISHLNYHAAVIAVSSDPKLAFSVHRVDGVIDNVGPNLV